MKLILACFGMIAALIAHADSNYPTDYQSLPASSALTTIGVAGGAGTYIDKLIIVPSTTTMGGIALVDSPATIQILMPGLIADIKPIVVPVGMRSRNGSFRLLSSGGAAVIAVGKLK